MLTTSLPATSPSDLSRIERTTASLIVSLARRMNLCRFGRLLPLGFNRRSMTFTAGPSAGLVHAHVPFHQTAGLARGVSTADHAFDEIVVFLLGFLVALGGEADYRQQVLDLGEHPLLDHLADLLIGVPGRILAAVGRPGPQGELDPLVAEVLGVGDARRLLDLGKLLIEHLA